MRTTTELAAEVVRSGAPGARVAHAVLFERILERIERYFRRMIGDPNEAEECVQRALVALEESLAHGKYDPGRSFNAWMWLKAHTVFAQWCRERERRPASLESPGALASREEDHALGSERALDGQAVLSELRARLGDEVYEAFVLYYEGGLTQAEVGAAIGRDLKTVRRRIAAAHALIDQLLGEGGGHPQRT